ncbi:unnamed protein product [Cuscuta epithymum]|uniref:C3H1-type domain-containing protein n=1 Tax=Cuscuta epithymum TaxID=186058 RepID=A0AAV0DIY4_9ASTE|nr:unnamed protein product [Cuscuta epithymum]
MDGSHRSNPQVTHMPTAASTPAPMMSADEEAIKKNTDCVYFLASPLTCKKGGECEYRHSDIARLNPRDCWYWLNGNCLNPKCAFRHPPLDALLDPEVPNPMESFMPPVQAMSNAMQMPPIPNKQGVPCIFFQKGICLKGDRCSFFHHAPNSLANKPPQKLGVPPTTTEISSKKTFGVLEKCTQEKSIPQVNPLKTGVIPPAVKPVVKNMTPSSFIDGDEPLLKYKPSIVPPSRDHVGRLSEMQPGLDDHDDDMQKDEEISREASPGFDVLVDDEVRDSDYYPVEDHYGVAGEHEGSEYDMDPSADYAMRDIDQEMYREAHGGGYDRLYGWEQRGASSERKPGRSYPERRRYGNNNTDRSDQVVVSDLRHRLSKPRRVNGLRSVISNDHTHEKRHDEGRENYHGAWRERNSVSSSHESSSLGSRLRGRINVPAIRSSSSPRDVVAEIRPEVDRSRERDRLSRGRLQDRMRGRLQEDPGFVGLHSGGPISRRDVFGEDDANFAAPKSLSELKGRKSGIERNGELSQGKRKHLTYDPQHQSGDDLSFEGPKPLEEILKRKRRAGDDNNGDYNNRQRGRASWVQKEDIQPIPPSSDRDHSGELEKNNNSVGDAHEVEDGMIADEEEGAEEYEEDVEEGYENQQDGQNYNYDEQVVGEEEVNLDEEEYLDEEDDCDDFAKKMAVVFS